MLLDKHAGDNFFQQSGASSSGFPQVIKAFESPHLLPLQEKREVY
jgi:hypothetical protein